MDKIGTCMFSIDDFGGALYATWAALNYRKVRIEDDSANIIWRGYITKKTHDKNSITFECKSIGIMLEWKSFTEKYILEEGLVKTVPMAGGDDSLLELKQDKEDDGFPDFGWRPDKWVSPKRGLIIYDTGNVDAETNWICTAISQVNGTEVSGDETDVRTVDGNFYYCTDATNDMVITATMDDDALPIAHYIKKLRLYYVFAVKVVDSGYTEFTIECFGKSKICYAMGDANWHWFIGNLDIEDTTDLDLASFLTLDGGEDNYVSIDVTITGLGGSAEIAIDQLDFFITSNPIDYDQIMVSIDENGASYIGHTGMDWDTDTSVSVDDSFRIGMNTRTILSEIGSRLGIPIVSISTLTKFVARYYKAHNCLSVLKSICKLEGAHWWEDYVNDKIVVAFESDFAASGVTVDESNYEPDWSYTEEADTYSRIDVWGAASLNIHKTIEDSTVDSPKELTIIDELIVSNADADSVAKKEFDKKKVKKPSIRIILDGINSSLTVGDTINLTMARPTIGAADYAIRRLDRVRRGLTGIKTVVYCGMGQTPLTEGIADVINENRYRSEKAHTDRLIGSTTAGLGGSAGNVNWDDIAGKTVGVEAIITDELADGESIDNRIDTLIDAITLTDIDNPSGNTEFNFANKHLHFKWVAPASGAHEGAFEIEASGGFSGDLIHIHQHTGNVGANTYMLFIECEDDDASCLHLVHGGNILDFGDLGLRLSADGRITEFDTDVNLAGGNTKVPTDLAVKTFAEAIGTAANAYADAKVSNEAYDPAAWEGDTTIAPSKQRVKDVFVSLTGATIYKGTYTPGDAYPATGIGWWYICDADGYTAAPGGADNTPDRWYEIGDWIIWNDGEVLWNILRNVQGDNILKVSPGDSIQTAIEEILLIGNGTIVLLPGTHTLTAALVIDNINVHLTIQGYGNVSIINVGGNWECITANNFKNLILKDFKIDTSLQTTAGKDGLLINETNDNKCIIEKVSIIGDDLLTTDGIHVQSEGVIIRNCYFESCRIGIHLDSAHKNNLYENTFYNIGIYPVYCQTSDYCILANNNIDGNGEVSDVGITINDCQYISLSDNYIDDCVVGINIWGQSDKGSYIGNPITNCSNVGIQVDVGDFNSITANVITDCGDGIQLDAGASNNYITVNMIENSTNEDIDDDSDGSNYILSRDTDINTVYVALWELGGATRSTGILCNNAGEYAQGFFITGKSIDASKNIEITWTWIRGDAGVDTLNAQIYIAYYPLSDGVLNVIDAWVNIEAEAVNGIAHNGHYVHTIAAGDVHAESKYLIGFKLNEARVITINTAQVEYFVNRNPR